MRAHGQPLHTLIHQLAVVERPVRGFSQNNPRLGLALTVT